MVATTNRQGQDGPDRGLSQEAMLNAISHAQERFIAHSSNAELFEGLLDAFLQATASEYGFIGEVFRTEEGAPWLKTHAITNIAWNEETRRFYEAHAPEGLEFRNLQTLFGATLLSGEPVIANDPAGDERSGGLPPGHPALEAFLGLPLLYKGEMVGMVGIANRSGGYGEEVLDHLDPLVRTTTNILYGIRVERGHEEALELAQRRQRELEDFLDGALDLIQSVAADGSILYANRAWRETLGYTDAELAELNLAALLDPECRERCLTDFQRVLEGEALNDVRAVFIARDGRRVHVRGTANRLVEEGETIATRAILRDVTAEVEASHALDRARRDLEDVFTLAEELICIVDMGSRFVRVNPAWERVLGYTEGELLGRSYMDLVHPEDRKRTLRESLRGRKGVGSRDFEVRFRDKQGGWRWMLWNTIPRVDREVVIGLARDISTQKQREEVLRESEALYRLLAENATDMISKHSPDGTYQFVSPVSEVMLGYKPEELVGRNAYDLFHEEDLERITRSHETIREMPVIYTVRYRLRRKDGFYTWVETTSRTVRNAAGEATEIVAVTRDITERMDTERALRESEERIRAVLDNVVDGIITIDDQGRIESVNPAAEQIFGHTARELVGRNVNQLMPEPYHSEHDGYIERYLETGEAKIIGHSREVRGRRRDGEVFPMDLAVSELQLDGRRVFVGVVRDISARRAAEQALQRSEASLKEAQRMTHLGNWEWDLRTNDVQWSDEVYRIFGLTPGKDTVDLETYMAYIHPEDISHVQRTIEKTLEEKSGYSIKHRIVRRSGEVRWIEGVGTFTYDDAGAATLLGTVMDITERENRSQALRESEARLAEAQRMARLGHWEWDMAPDRFELSEGASRLLGYPSPPRSLPFSAFLDRVPLKMKKPLLAAFHSAIGRGTSFSLEHTLLALDGREYTVYTQGRAVYGTEGDSVRVIGTIQDISELAEARQLAEEANRAKSSFLASMSHELRTPLNAVIGFANILRKNKEGNLAPGQQLYLDRIADNGAHLLDLINDVLDLSKVEAGRMTLELEEVDLADLVGSTIAQLESQAEAKGLAMTAEVPGGLAPLRADRGRLRQVLINLAGNSLKFTEEGRVSVRVLPDSEGKAPGALEVTDTGIGIPADKLATIFESFRQADASTTRRYGGTGLGLAISRQLCHLMGFQLEVESTEGVGSTFRILFESGEREEAGAGAKEATPAKEAETGGAPRIGLDSSDRSRPLVVAIDDDPDSRLLIASAVWEAGGVVAAASDGDSGLRLARELQPALITLDLRMPGRDGEDVLAELMEDNVLHSIPVVVISAHLADLERELEGVRASLAKPLDEGHFQELLRPLLAQGKQS